MTEDDVAVIGVTGKDCHWIDRMQGKHWCGGGRGSMVRPLTLELWARVAAKLEKVKAPRMAVVPPQPPPLAIGETFREIFHDNQKLGTGLIISLNEGEKRRVSRRLKEVDQQSHATWVPVGSPHQATFEKGESFGVLRDGPSFSGLQLVEQVHSRPAELNPVKENNPLTFEHSGSHEEIVKGEGVAMRDPDWFVQLKDGRRLVLPDFLPSPWSKPTNPIPPIASCVTVAAESMELLFSGTLEAEAEVVEGVFEELSSDSMGLEVVSLPESDTLHFLDGEAKH
ncbi:hypothetical protein FCV25MIE_03178 [Fagus crenata]